MKNCKRLICFGLAFLLILFLMPAAGAADVVKTGKCGVNLTYTLYSDGSLKIDGTGDMFNYCSYSGSEYPFYCCLAPWGNKVTDVAVGGGVTSIGSDAFFRCLSLSSVSLPEGLEQVGENAFFSCCALSAVDLPKSVVCVHRRAFYGCSALTSVTMGGCEKILGREAFAGCSALTSVTLDGVTEIGRSAFANCGSLSDISIPDTVADVGDQAFMSCAALRTAAIGNGVKRLGSSAFSGCEALAAVTFGGSVTEIGDKAFYGCTSLAAIELPESVASIGTEAFYGCTSLARVSFGSGIKSVGADAFKKCYPAVPDVYISDIASWCGVEFENEYSNPLQHAGLLYVNGEIAVDIEIPTGVTAIGNYAFYGYRRLHSVVVPDSVTSIGRCAFFECKDLGYINFPDSITKIGGSAFYNTAWFNGQNPGIVYAGNIACGFKRNYSNSAHYFALKEGCTGIADGAFFGWDDLYTITIPDSVTYIGKSAFEHCTWMDIVSIGNGVKYIGESAFSDCWRLKYVNIPDSVIEIGRYAFDECSGLSDVTIPEGMTEIGDYAFYNCKGLSSVIITKNVRRIGCNAFRDCSALSCLEIENGVTQIGKAAFYGTGITSVSIPESVTEIGCDAFANTPWLSAQPEGMIYLGKIAFLYKAVEQQHYPTEMTLREDCTGIAGGAFAGCWHISEISIPDSVAFIGDRAFYNCNNLASVSIPENVTSIGGEAFYGCTELSSVLIPERVRSIGEAVFYCCKNLTELKVSPENTVYHSENNCIIETASGTLIAGCKTSVIPSDGSVTRIGGHAFAECVGLTSIDIPADVTEIGPYAFQGCTGLLSVSIGKNMTEIADMAFDYCTALRVKNYHNPEEDWDRIRIGSGNASLKNASLYCHGSPFERTTVDAPACTDQGAEYVRCLTCGYDEIVPLQGKHIWGDWSETAAPGCETAGEETRGCVNCAETETRSVDPLGHDWAPAVLVWSDDYSTCTVSVVCRRDAAHVKLHATGTAECIYGEPPTCTEPGEAGYQAYISGYGYAYTDVELSPLGHTYTRVIADEDHLAAPATCTAPASYYCVCVRCDEVDCDTTAPAGGPDLINGHVWGDWEPLDDNAHRRVCGRDASHVEKAAHDWKETSFSPGTCVVKSVRTFACAVCGAAKTEFGDFEAHAWGEWIQKDEKQHQRICAVDPTHTETADHVWDDGFVTLAAAEGTEGEMTFTCTVCGEKKTEPIPAKEPGFIRGDVNSNGVVETGDARLALRCAIGLESYPGNSREFKAADVTANGVVGTDDARCILRRAVGLKNPEIGW